MTLMLGCGGPSLPKPKSQEPTFPVTGTIQVDGKPAANAYLFFHKASAPSENPSNPNTDNPNGGIAGPDGKFAASTYKSGDGLPAGEYILAVFWDGGIPPDLDRRNDDDGRKLPPDAVKINKKYGTSARSELKFTIESKPNDLGVIELTTKPAARK